MEIPSALGFGYGLPGAVVFKRLKTEESEQKDKFRNLPQVKREIDYFLAKAKKITSTDEFFKDRRFLSVALSAFALESEIDYPGRIKKVMSEPLTNDDGTINRKALANRLQDPRYAEVAKAFDFSNSDVAKLKDERFLQKIIDRFVTNEFEKSLGGGESTLREAAYFRRKIASVLPPGFSGTREMSPGTQKLIEINTDLEKTNASLKSDVDLAKSILTSMTDLKAVAAKLGDSTITAAERTTYEAQYKTLARSMYESLSKATAAGGSLIRSGAKDLTVTTNQSGAEHTAEAQDIEKMLKSVVAEPVVTIGTRLTDSHFASPTDTLEARLKRGAIDAAIASIDAAVNGLSASQSEIEGWIGDNKEQIGAQTGSSEAGGLPPDLQSLSKVNANLKKNAAVLKTDLDATQSVFDLMAEFKVVTTQLADVSLTAAERTTYETQYKTLARSMYESLSKATADTGSFIRPGAQDLAVEMDASGSKYTIKTPDVESILQSIITKPFVAFGTRLSDSHFTPPADAAAALAKLGTIDTALESTHDALDSVTLDRKSLLAKISFNDSVIAAGQGTDKTTDERSVVYKILGDKALRSVVTQTLGLPPQLALQGVETQARAVLSRLDVKKFADPKYVDKFLERFLTQAQMSKGPAGPQSLVLQLLQPGRAGSNLNLYA